MKSTTHRSIAKQGLALAGILLLAGCADWGSDPFRVQRDYGNSVRSLVANQINDPYTAEHPSPQPLDGIEGNKANRILDQAYRTDIGSPQRVRTTRDISGGVGGGLGGGGAGGTGGAAR